jgi:hypothetical protein
MRFILACLFFAALGVPLGPSSSDFHHWYNEPIVERFAARPGINVTVEYGSDRLACEMRISPARSLVEEERLQAAIQGQRPTGLSQEEISRRMSTAAVTELIEQIAPAAMRGKLFGSVAFQASCGAFETYDYENVRISRGVAVCEPKEEEGGSVSISFKRDVCPKSDSPYMKK